MRFCEICQKLPVFGTDKKTRIGYCKSHQYLRTDISKETIAQKALLRQKKNILNREKSTIRAMATIDENIELSNDYAKLDTWFRECRKEMKGKCQCGCGKPSSKYDDKYFKYSCSHVFPKSKFGSIKTHPRNFVERAFWGGCHSVMDDTSMDRWVGFADWENIKEIFHELAPLLTNEERATKFYTHFEKLVYG